MEQAAATLHDRDPALAARYLTDHSLQQADRVVSRWRELGEELICRYNDGYVKDADGRPQEVGYPEAWLRHVVDERPRQFLLPEDAGGLSEPVDY